MRINRIVLKNFRNYENEQVVFDPGVNFIIGDNAQGKTNLVEAIYYAGYGKSFRYAKDRHLIRSEAEGLYYGLEYETDYGTHLIEVKMNEKKEKEIRIDRQPIKRISELIGMLNVIIFTPEDLQIIREGPAYRRRFLDRQIALIDKVYYNLLIEYNRVLSQRNSYLRNLRGKAPDPILIETFDEQLIGQGVRILKKRMSFVEKMKPLTRDIHASLTDGKEMFEIGYLSSIVSHSGEDYGKIEEEYLRLMKASLERDRKLQNTHVGPHRDDLKFTINHKEIKAYGSQGQVRTACLTLVLSVLSLTREETGEDPILLLDDVFSELDHKRKNMLVGYIKNIQTLITATDLEGIDREWFDLSSVHHVSNGRIRRA